MNVISCSRYGFGAPYILGGPLGDSDPGCGVAELSDALDRFPNLQNLGGTVYSALANADGTQDPYTLLESRHLPAVKLYDLQVGAQTGWLSMPKSKSEL